VCQGSGKTPGTAGTVRLPYSSREAGSPNDIPGVPYVGSGLWGHDNLASREKVEGSEQPASAVGSMSWIP